LESDRSPENERVSYPYTADMKMRPLIVIAALAAFFAALARKRAEEAKPIEGWEPVSYT
jgi:hypothetical protein